MAVIVDQLIRIQGFVRPLALQQDTQSTRTFIEPNHVVFVSKLGHQDEIDT